MQTRRLLGALIDRLPASETLYRVCRRYANRYEGQNNADMASNGELRWLCEALPACAVVFDVGANVGEWTACSLQVNPALHVHCFEPSADAFRALEARGLPERVILNQEALGDRAGEATLYVSAPGDGTNSLHKRNVPGIVQSAVERIRVDTLDRYCARMKVESIDLLKLDVEGHELAALKGAAGMLAGGRIRQIQFEYGGTYIDAGILLKDVIDFLASSGFRIFKIFPDSLRPVERYDQRLENFQYQNLVAIR